MTIEERLEKLTERHEALTQSVELLAAESRQTADENKQRDWRINELSVRMGDVMEGIARLLHVAEIQERIERLEGGPE